MTDPMTPRQAIEFAVKTEELGTKFYQQLAVKFSGEAELKELFELLAKDEVMHERQFRKLLERTPPDEGVSTGPEFQYLRAMSLSQFFMGAEGLKKKCKEIKDKDDALGIAFELEKAWIAVELTSLEGPGLSGRRRKSIHFTTVRIDEDDLRLQIVRERAS